MNLEAVAAETNQEKGEKTASEWLPEDEDDACFFVVRQVTIKSRYNLTVTEAERQTLQRAHQPVLHAA
jgi:hypothetical protein